MTRKKSKNFNRTEKNVCGGLHDIPTLTELAVLVLCAETVSYSYLRSVHGLEEIKEKMHWILGLFTKALQEHTKRLIDTILFWSCHVMLAGSVF